MTNVTPAGAGVTGPAIYIGGTTVANATNGYLLYNNNNVLGNISIASITPPIVVGTTVVSGGTSGRVLYDNAGVLGEMTNTGTGTVNVLQTSPSLITPALGVATATSLAIGGATIGSNALAVTGTTALGDTLTITPATANTSGLVITGGTVTTAVPLISATRTWNNAGVTFTSLLYNIIDTASNAASLLMDLQKGSVSQFSVGKSGNVTATGNLTLGVNASINALANLFLNSTAYIGGSAAGTSWVQVNSSRISLTSGMVVGMASGSDPSAGPDVGISRISAGVMAVGTGAGASVAGTLQAALYQALPGTAVGAGANTQAFIKASSTANLGLYYGTGDPGFAAAKGSLYVKTDATTTTTRLWVNTDGSTTWTFFTSNA